MSRSGEAGSGGASSEAPGWRTVLAEASLLFTDDAARAEKDFAALLRDGIAWLGRPGLSARHLAMLQRLSDTRPDADPRS